MNTTEYNALPTPELLDVAFDAERRLADESDALALIFALAWRLKGSEEWIAQAKWAHHLGHELDARRGRTTRALEAR